MGNIHFNFLTQLWHPLTTLPPIIMWCLEKNESETPVKQNLHSKI